MIEITDELLSEVYNTDANVVKVVFNETSKLVVYRDNQIKDKLFPVNIYELAHKCKEWACKEGFILNSYTKPYKDVDKKGYCQIHHTQDKNRENDKPFNCIYEVEAIFKACEWILGKIKEGN